DRHHDLQHRPGRVGPRRNHHGYRHEDWYELADDDVQRHRAQEVAFLAFEPHLAHRAPLAHLEPRLDESALATIRAPQSQRSPDQSDRPGEAWAASPLLART